jgi:hypothetical protein
MLKIVIAGQTVETYKKLRSFQKKRLILCCLSFFRIDLSQQILFETIENFDPFAPLQRKRKNIINLSILECVTLARCARKNRERLQFLDACFRERSNLMCEDFAILT